MSHQVSITVKPTGSYYFCLRLLRAGFRLYEANQISGEKDAITNDSNRIINLSSKGAPDHIVIQAIFNGPTLPEDFSKDYSRIKFVKDITWRFSKD